MKAPQGSGSLLLTWGKIGAAGNLSMNAGRPNAQWRGSRPPSYAHVVHLNYEAMHDSAHVLPCMSAARAWLAAGQEHELVSSPTARAR